MFYCSLWLRGNQIRAVEIFTLVVSPAIYNYTALCVLSISRVYLLHNALTLTCLLSGVGHPTVVSIVGIICQKYNVLCDTYSFRYSRVYLESLSLVSSK